MGEYSLVEREGGLTIITINRPEVMNALHQWLANRELYRDFNEFLRNS